MNKNNIIIIFVLMTLFSCRKDEVDVYRTVRNVSELQLAEFSMSKTAIIRDAFDEEEEQNMFEYILNGVEKRIKKGNRVGVYGFSQKYKVYINLEELMPEDVIIQDKNITIKLPQIKIEKLGDDLNPTIHHERVSGWRSSITSKERERAVRKASREIDKKFYAAPDSLFGDIKKRANKTAKAWLTSFLHNLDYQNITIIEK